MPAFVVLIILAIVVLVVAQLVSWERQGRATETTTTTSQTLPTPRLRPNKIDRSDEYHLLRIVDARPGGTISESELWSIELLRDPRFKTVAQGLSHARYLDEMPDLHYPDQTQYCINFLGKRLLSELEQQYGPKEYQDERRRRRL